MSAWRGSRNVLNARFATFVRTNTKRRADSLRRPGEGRDPALRVGTLGTWIPAYAGMTSIATRPRAVINPSTPLHNLPDWPRPPRGDSRRQLRCVVPPGL